jgi:transposase-like protein
MGITRRFAGPTIDRAAAEIILLRIMAGTLHLTYPPHDVVSGHCVMASNVLSAPHFQNEAAAFAYVEARLWPNGPVCHHCGETERIGRLQGKTTRPGLYKCYACRKPFTVRMGTIFESSHLPLHLWLQIIHLMCASKKGISTHQIQRMLRCSMKTAWFLGHRIRESMREVRDMFTPPMGGAGRTIEADPLAEASATARRRQRTMRSP